jgi:hypothetical protein
MSTLSDLFMVCHREFYPILNPAIFLHFDFNYSYLKTSIKDRYKTRGIVN